MRQPTQNAGHDIQWILFSQLEDLDYADNIVLLSTTANHLQMIFRSIRKDKCYVHEPH